MSVFRHENRGSMSPQRIARIYADNGGKCHVCGRKLVVGDKYEIDHKHALELGGTDDDSNLAPICEGCHIIKTAGDHAEAGHMRRSFTKHVVPSDKMGRRKWR